MVKNTLKMVKISLFCDVVKINVFHDLKFRVFFRVFSCFLRFLSMYIIHRVVLPIFRAFTHFKNPPLKRSKNAHPGGVVG